MNHDNVTGASAAAPHPITSMTHSRRAAGPLEAFSVGQLDNYPSCE